MGNVIGSFIGGLLAIGAAIFIFKRMTKKSSPEQQPKPTVVTPKKDPNKELANITNSLVRSNVKIRTTYGLTPEVIQLVEEIIDFLKTVVPQMMERHSSETLTYELKRISVEHLPEIIKEFVDLSEDSRKRHHDSFIQSLIDIRDQVKRANEIVEQNEQAEFKVMASFLKTKYSEAKI
jgi:hypothetical protein